MQSDTEFEVEVPVLSLERSYLNVRTSWKALSIPTKPLSSLPIKGRSSEGRKDADRADGSTSQCFIEIHYLSGLPACFNAREGAYKFKYTAGQG